MRKKRKQVNLYEKESNIRGTLILKWLMIVLKYKEACLSINELNPFLSSVIVSSLQELEEILPEKIPNGLSLIRRIDHQIDFIPRVSIPNRQAYESNLEVTKELQRWVSELIKKGYVRESISHCTVLVLLVPKEDVC